MIELETPEQFSAIPIPQDHRKSNDELERIRKELHDISNKLDSLVKVLRKRGQQKWSR